jgi:hypothetical protein
LMGSLDMGSAFISGPAEPQPNTNTSALSFRS